ncbi:hypothetical protein ACFXTN_019836 [Malus domestica]
MTAIAIDEEEPPNAIFAKPGGDAEHRDRCQNRLRAHDNELEPFNLILLTVGAVEHHKHNHRKSHTDESQSRPGQGKAQPRRLVEAQESEKRF